MRPSVSLGVATLALVAPTAGAGAQEPAARPRDERAEADARLAGYVEALLERELGWARGSFRVRAASGVATVTLARDDAAGREPELARLSLPHRASLEVELVDDLEAATRREGSRGFFDRLLSLSEQELRYPLGDVFQPLLADPKTPQFFASLRGYDTPDRDTIVGAVGFGETFGLWRRVGVRDGDGLQVGIGAGLFAQFDLDTESADLINADYTIGLPLTWRSRDTSARLRVYHQSSHLGDEFLLEPGSPERINLSFESLELLLSRDVGRARGYLGGEWLFHRDPDDLDPWGLHGGVEWRGEKELWGLGRPIAGLDLKSWQEHGWSLDAALSFGIERGSDRPGRRRVRWMIDLYDGHAPHGQFYEDEIFYAGLGLYLGF